MTTAARPLEAPVETGVLVSGSGRTLLNLLQLERAGRLPIRITQVVSSKPGVRALEHAAAFDVPAAVAKPSETTAIIEKAGCRLIVMAGYLRRWPLPEHLEGRTINVHPSLLPLFGGKGFYGDHVHAAVLASGMRVSGATVHFVTEAYDEGPIIEQASVPVRDHDTVEALGARVFDAERELLPRVIRDLVAGRVWMEEGRTRRAGA